MKAKTTIFPLQLIIALIVGGYLFRSCDRADKSYQPTWESIEQHEVPDWYDDAKFGIFIHWGVYAVPAWAPVGGSESSSQYSEWYPFHMYKEGDTTYKYHRKHYGKLSEFGYKDFIPMFTAEKWDPEQWAQLFKDAGARYVVPVGEHHDGFPMWDSDLTEWDAMDKGPKRDIIGELAKAVRERNMKYAPSYHRMMNYYDPSFEDGHFNNPHYSEDGPDSVFVKNWKERWEELRDKYKPDIIWFDGDWMAPVDVWGTKQIVADYYNTAREWGKEVLVNDRLGEVRGERGDFYTTEYEYGIQTDTLITHKWESCRGIGGSFGYNKNEEPEDYMSVNELVDMLVDIVSKNGNLLLNIGPKADGTIPEIQKERLLGIGEWLQTNGEAIYGTDYWETYGEDNIRFTRKGDHTLYAIALEWPGEQVTIRSLGEGMKGEIQSVSMLGSDSPLNWDFSEEGLTIDTPSEKPCEHAYAFKISLR
ncbi:MAG: alpha-L-fucosidase [Bacteroidales bacterium]